MMRSYSTLTSFCLFFGAVMGLMVGHARAARADGDIVFAATEYRWSATLYRQEGDEKPEHTVEKMGTSHLYRINPDGTGCKQITFGSYNDQSPHFSPDGKQILFLRKEPLSSRSDEMDSAKLCLVAADGGAVKTLAHSILVDSYRRVPAGKLGWSPDGRTIGYISEQGLVLLDASGHAQRTIKEVEEFHWSPDGHEIYLGRQGSGRILDLTTGKLSPIKAHLYHPNWIDNNSLIGILASDKPPYSAGDLSIATVDNHGSALKKLAIDIRDKFVYSNEWSRLQTDGLSFLFVTRHGMSDGEHHECSLIDVGTLKMTEFFTGDLIALAPDGKYCAGAKHEWIGPYKHGGERLGALEIIDLATKKTTAITSELMDISDGDWLKSK